MKQQQPFRDIVNRDIVNLENCESEPIHIPGSIQPHGFLIAVSADEHRIRFCSGNTKSFIGLGYEDLLGSPLVRIFRWGTPGALLDYISNEPAYADAPLRLQVNDAKLECVAHRIGDLLVLEFEPEQQEAPDQYTLYLQTRQFINHIENSTSLQELCQRVCDEIQRITGYDRVMVYRFDEQYNGEVFAESLGISIEPFLGLHYPHTDIPVQARELYLRNLLRVIVDVNYTPVPVFTLDDGGSTVLDMSQTSLRSVSPIHIRYLQNMGVGATLTISLVQDQKLWGLVACHHYNPKYISNAARVSARLQGHFLTSQIRVREANEEYDRSRGINEKLQSLLAFGTVFTRQTVRELVEQPALREICFASGVVVTLNGDTYTAGRVPEPGALQELLQWLKENHEAGMFYTDKLSEAYPAGTAIIETAAGILFHSLGAGKGTITWFRQETLKEVHWGGDPEKAILRDEQGLSPRKSFALWKEVVKGKSNPWQKPELSAAESFTHYLQRQLHLIFITEEEARYRALSTRLQEANAELENINFISAHDLKEPLRKIQVFASRILSEKDELPAMVVRSVEKMQSSAQRMQLLITDIISYARVSHTDESFSTVDLNKVLDTAREELKDELEASGAMLEADNLPQVKGVEFLFVQVFLNLLRNAIKFVAPGQSPRIRIRNAGQAMPADNELPGSALFHRVSIEDQGIGFDNEFRENIFQVFTRLQGSEEYEGSGIGLALCRKIMQNHGGMIRAEGRPGEGARFDLFFPV